MVNSGSITQGSPISPPSRVSNDQQQYPSTANNQLVNPRYSYYMNNKSKQRNQILISFFAFFCIDEQQFSSSRQSSTSPLDHSPKGKFARRTHQVKFLSIFNDFTSDVQQNSFFLNIIVKFIRQQPTL